VCVCVVCGAMLDQDCRGRAFKAQMKTSKPFEEVANSFCLHSQAHSNQKALNLNMDYDNEV